MGRIGTVVFGALLALGLAAPVAAQEAPNRFDVVERIARCHPGLILHGHAFVDAVASDLHAQDPAWGRNGKRGNVNDPSDDAIAYRNAAGPGGVSIVDVIVAAGAPDASPGWQDVTQLTRERGTIGAWVAPSGRVLPCDDGSGGGDGPPAPDEGSGGPVGPSLTEAIDLLRADVRALADHVAGLRASFDAQAELLHRRQDAASERLEALFDRQTRRIFGVLVEGDGSMPAGVAEETINRLYERTARGDRLRVRAW